MVAHSAVTRKEWVQLPSFTPADMVELADTWVLETHLEKGESSSLSIRIIQ